MDDATLNALDAMVHGAAKFQAVIDELRAKHAGNYPYCLEITGEGIGDFSPERFHSAALCVGQICVIHNPSSHGMVWWPMHVRVGGLIERLCPHGIGHPDPDSVAYYERIQRRSIVAVHGCDGCCKEEP